MRVEFPGHGYFLGAFRVITTRFAIDKALRWKVFVAGLWYTNVVLLNENVTTVSYKSRHYVLKFAIVILI
jgi:hypothetical protein